MLWLYRFLFLPVLLFASPYYLLRMKRRGGYRKHFSHRLGRVDAIPEKRPGVRRIWIQAVSVGEMFAIGPLLEAFRQDDDVEFFLTTTTSTGYKVARERYQELTIGIGYFPIDWWLFARGGWERIAPDLMLLTEGERWPEHIHQAVRRRIPMLCINARMSDRSFRRSRALAWAATPLLGGISRILACSEHDAARFRELGFPAERVVVTGNLKLDLNIPLLGDEEKHALRRELGLGDANVLLGSSVWPGEDLAMLETLKAAREAGENCRLLLVPRHAERRTDIEALVKSHGFSYHLRSRGPALRPVDVTIGDTTGELRKLTQVAEVVFVGKSLPPHEQGQTPVEAAALGKPILFGPGMSNFRVIAQELVAAGAAQRVPSAEALPAAVLNLLADAKARTTMADAALNWHRTNRGAVNRTVELIREELAALPVAGEVGAEA